MFLTQDHQERYEMVISRLGYVDSNWRGALFILTANLASWADAEKYVDVSRRLIDFRAMKRIIKQGPHTTGNLQLVELANEIFNCNGKVEIATWWDYLTDTEFDLVVLAIQHMRRCWRG